MTLGPAVWLGQLELFTSTENVASWQVAYFIDWFVTG